MGDMDTKDKAINSTSGLVDQQTSGPVVTPTINSQTRKDFEDKYNFVRENKYARTHYDIVDKSYNEPTWYNHKLSYEYLNSISEVVVHMMIARPCYHLLKHDKALPKRDYIYLISDHKIRSIEKIRQLKKAGYSIGIVVETHRDTPISLPIEQMLQEVSEVMFLTVSPGKNGGSVIDGSIDRLVEFEAKYRELIVENNVRLSIDGGYSSNTDKLYKSLPIDEIYAGSFFFS